MKDYDFLLTPDDVMFVNALTEISAINRKREFLREVIDSIDCAQWNSFCMGHHPRLGSESILRFLPSDVFGVIRKYNSKLYQELKLDSHVEDILLLTDQIGCSVTTSIEVYVKHNMDLVSSILYFR